MKRHLLGLALGALVSFAFAGNAEACHGKKKACATPTPTCAPAPVVCEPAPVVYQPAPVCPPVETCAPAPKKHCFSGVKLPKFHMPKFKLHGHKSAPVCAETVAYQAAPVVYAAPQASPQASPQVYAAPQASAQN